MNEILNAVGAVVLDPEVQATAAALAEAVGRVAVNVGGLFGAGVALARGCRWLRVAAGLAALLALLCRPFAWAYRRVRPAPNEALAAVLGHLRDPDPTFSVEKCGKVATLIAGDLGAILVPASEAAWVVTERGAPAPDWVVSEVRVGDEEVRPGHFAPREWRRLEAALRDAVARARAKQEAERLAREAADRRAAQERILRASLKAAVRA